MEVSEAQAVANNRLELTNIIVSYFIAEAETSRRGALRLVPAPVTTLVSSRVRVSSAYLYPHMAIQTCRTPGIHDHCIGLLMAVTIGGMLAGFVDSK